MTAARTAPRPVNRGRPAAREDVCRRCGAPVLRGLDGDVMARSVTADPPLGPARSSAVLRRAVVALLTGRAVLGMWPGQSKLIDVDRWMLSGRLIHVLCLEHVCGQPWPLPTDSTDERTPR